MKTSVLLVLACLALAAAPAAVRAADGDVSAGGAFLKIQGQSGKMTFARNEPVGSDPDRVEVQMVKLQQLDAAGAVLGAGGSSKSSFNSFATQSFTIGQPVAGTYAGIAAVARAANASTTTPTTYVARNYSVTKIQFSSLLGSGQASDSKLGIDAIIFDEDALLSFPNLNADGSVNATRPTVRLAVPKGSLKFNLEFSQWNWCSGSGSCKNGDGVGAAIAVTVSFSTQKKAGAAVGGGAPNATASVTAMGNGAQMAVVDSYAVVSAGGSSTSYRLAEAVAVDVSDSGSSITTSMTLTVPRTHFGATDRLVYDPIVSYGDLTIDGNSGGDGGDNAAGPRAVSALVTLVAVLAACVMLA